jgi:formate hydrogenlyase subunit 6/NADH:ubiquinone oxidoreductase subunit I
MENEKIYEGFIEWFRQCGAYVPESVALGPLIQETYTAEEAELLTGMPLTLFEIDDFAANKGKDPSKLRAKLDEMASRGLVYRSHAKGKAKYRLNPPRFVFLRSFFWPGRDDEHTKSVAPHVTRYYLDGLGDHWKDVKSKGLRAIPIEKTIDDPRCVLPYEAVLQVLQDQNRFAVATCACRHRKNSDPNLPNCNHETENCLHFGKFADYIIENGLGREIDLEECREILGRAADAGLVHAASNWQENVDTICNCCQCCCVYLEAFHVLKHDHAMNHSNFLVQINPDTCLGCGLCVKRCPMDALRLVESPRANNKTGKVSTAQTHICIGCGICAYKCSTNSLILKRRENTVDPPANAAELKKRYAAEKAEKYAKEGRSMGPEDAYMGDISSGEVIGEAD